MDFLKRKPTPSEIAAYIEDNPEQVSAIYRTHLAKRSKENLEAAFHDNQGRLYYTFRDADRIPAERVAEAHVYLQFLAAGIDPDTFKESIKTIEAHFAKGETVNACAVLHFMSEHGRRIVNFDAMVNVIAVNHVREDEDPMIFNKTIHAEKCNFLKSETQEGRFFFRLPMCLKFLNDATLSTKDLETLWAEYIKGKDLLRQILDSSTTTKLQAV